jgi:hypothetical protein
MLTVTAKLTLYSPISSKQGLYGSLQNGTFLSDHPPKATLVDNARDTVQLGVLAQLFRVMVMSSLISPPPKKKKKKKRNRYLETESGFYLVGQNVIFVIDAVCDKLDCYLFFLLG